MATNRFLGHALDVAQVDTQTYGGTWEATDVINYTINGKTVSVVAGSTTIATIIATVVTALNDSEIPEFAEITWAAASSTTLTGTADTAGKPFTLTVATTETGGGAADAQTLSNSTTTTSAGRNDVSAATNWSLAAVPAGTNDVSADNIDVDLLYGLDQSGVGTMATLRLPMSFTGKVGLPINNTDAGSGENQYAEYRARFWALAATLEYIGQGTGSGSSRIMRDGGSVQQTIEVYNTGSPEGSSLGAFIWKGTNASNTMRVWQGSVSVAPFPGEVATLATLRNIEGTVDLSPSVTLTTVEQIAGGQITARSAMTTLTIRGGTVIVEGSGAITTVTFAGPGTLIYKGSGTIGTVNGNGGGVLDASQNEVGFTVTTMNLNGAFTVNDPNKRITVTTPVIGSGVTRIETSIAG